MSSSARTRRVIRAAPAEDEVFVLGESTREAVCAPALATGASYIALADDRARAIVAEAGRQAEALVADAHAAAATVRKTAYDDGFEAGRPAALAELSGVLELVRRAAAEAKRIRDEIAAQSGAVVARAAALATRRIVGEYYEADPERTALVCADALRAAAGQEILSIRVSPGLAGHVQATLVDAARYVTPDESVRIGGCVVDLRHGTLDATLDARLSLMDLALLEAGGEALR